MHKGAHTVAGRLRIEMRRKGVDVDVLVNTCDSIDLCDIGPNILVYPDRLIYHGVQVKDIPDIVESLREGGQPVERLILHPHAGQEQVRREIYAAATQSDTVPAGDFLALAQERGFDERWVAEQARRGFIARKEIDGQPVITVTTKARHRYGVGE